MPLLNLTPQFKFLVYPQSAIPNRKIDPFVIADGAADLISGAPSDWGGVFVKGLQGYGTGNWKRIGADLTITNAGFARFLPDGTVEKSPQSPQQNAWGGFYVIPTLRPTSLLAGGSVSAVAGQPTRSWTAFKGTWETSPASAGRGTAILSTSQGDTGIASNTPLVRNGGFEINLDFITYDTTNAGEAFLEYGPDVRLAMRNGQPPAIERRVLTQNGMVQQSSWTTWRRLTDEVFTPRGTRARFAVSQIGGRKVVEWNNKTIWLLEENQQSNAQKGVGDRARAGIPQWGDVPLRLEAKGCRVRAEMATMDHLNDAGTAPKVATITRTVPLSSASSYESRLIKPVAVGFVPDGADMDISVVHGDDSLTYTTTIRPSDDGMHSPCYAQGLLTYDPVWTNGTGSPVDFTAAVTSSRVTLAQPPAQSGSEGSVTVDFKLAAKLCPAALPLLRDFAPIEVFARWVDDATATPLSDYRGLMQGYLHGSEGEEPAFNQEGATFTIRDPMVRLHDEAGVIDGSFYDLVVAFQRVTDENIGLALKDIQADAQSDVYINPFEDNTTYVPASAGNFYGGHCIKELLRIQLGPDAANRLNGNGDPTRFIDASHPPLLNRFDMAGSIAALGLALDQTLGIGSLGGDGKGGFFPPPYGQKDVLGWGVDIATDDQCDFWTGHVNRNTDVWPSFLYGKYEVYLDSAMGWQLGASDAIAIAGLIESANAETRPETAINRVLVWVNPFGVEIPYTPAFIQGEARIASGPNAPQNSYTRTLILQEGFAKWITTPAQAAAVAATVLLDIADTAAFYPRYKMRGDARFLVGDVFFASGLGLNINDLYVRASKITHEYNVSPDSGKWWTTEIELQPMTNRQIARFQRNNNLRTGYTFE